MLPWLQKKSKGSISGTVEDGKMIDHEGSPMHSVAQELIDAVHAKDPAAVASALQAAISLADQDEGDSDASNAG